MFLFISFIFLSEGKVSAQNAFDAEGNPHPLAADQINIELKGDATIAGVGNGNPQSFEPFQANNVHLFYGKAMIIVKAGHENGKAKLSVSSEGLGGDNVTINIE